MDLFICIILVDHFTSFYLKYFIIFMINTDLLGHTQLSER